MNHGDAMYDCDSHCLAQPQQTAREHEARFVLPHLKKPGLHTTSMANLGLQPVSVLSSLSKVFKKVVA